MYKKKIMEQSANPALDKAMRVSRITVYVNVVLSLGKFAAGVVGRSGAMISDAVHSLSDVFSTFVVMAGIKMADKKEDTEHPYGHERMECVAAIILAVFLAVIGAGIGIGGIKNIAGGSYEDLTVPGALSLVAAVVSIAVKEWMYHYTKRTAVMINSGALLADAWHHRSDAMSSVGAFVGILFAMIGFPVMDAVASVLISLMIVKAAYDIFRDGLNKMIDRSCDEETEAEMRNIILNETGVLGIKSMKTRLFGSKMYLDLEIFADGELTLIESHAIAHRVHDAIEAAFPQCKHCMVHVDPRLPDVKTKE